VAVQPDGKVVAGGVFTTMNGASHNYIARLNADGNADNTFNAVADSTVMALIAQPDGKLVIAGAFTTVNGQSHARIARLRADGNLDNTFAADANAMVWTLALQPDGKLIVGGEFTLIDGQAHNHLVRLNVDGSVDTTFNPNADNAVYSLALQTDGKLVTAGVFTAIDGQHRASIARFSAPQPALQLLDIADAGSDGSTVTWARSGAGPELALPPQLLFSLDGSNYTSAGTMDRVASGWRKSGFVPPLDQTFYLRVRGHTGSGAFTGSAGLIESTRQFHLRSDAIFADGFE